MTRSPADDAGRNPFAHLAGHLTALRDAARLTQRALADAANISRNAVQRAESGTAPPTAAVLDAYLRACGADPADHDKARRLHTLGRTAQRGKLRALQAPAPAFVRDERDLGLVLAAAYERAGAPPLRDFDRPDRTRIPLATASRIVNRKALPASREQLITFLTVCGISPAAQRPYLDAYHHVIAQRGTRPAPPRAWPRQLTGRIIRSGPPVPDIGAFHDIDFGRLAAALRPVVEFIAATQARYYDTDRLAASIRPFAQALAADRDRYDVHRLAAGIRPTVEALALMFRSASREAHRNGTTPPDWITATDLLTHRTCPGTPPPAPGLPDPTPPAPAPSPPLLLPEQRRPSLQPGQPADTGRTSSPAPRLAAVTSSRLVGETGRPVSFR